MRFVDGDKYDYECQLCALAGKSAALIMRKIRPEAMAEAQDLAVREAGEWLAALALREGATPPSLLAKMRGDAAARCTAPLTFPWTRWSLSRRHHQPTCVVARSLRMQRPPSGCIAWMGSRDGSQLLDHSKVVLLGGVAGSSRRPTPSGTSGGCWTAASAPWRPATGPPRHPGGSCPGRAHKPGSCSPPRRCRHWPLSSPRCRPH